MENVNMFKELPEGQTHSYGDGCGDKNHNKFCKDCMAHGWWEGKHDCPPFLKYLIKNKKPKSPLYD